MHQEALPHTERIRNPKDTPEVGLEVSPDLQATEDIILGADHTLAGGDQGPVL